MTSISLLGLTTGCASLAHPDMGAAPAFRSRLTLNARSVLAQDEIQAAQARNAFELVQGLRPEYLLGGVETPGEPGQQTRGLPRVYVDGLQLASGIAGLSTIPAGRVAEIRYLDANAPSNWHGRFGNRSAVILVETRP